MYFLGSKSLTVGSNNLSTTVSGVIADGGLNPAFNLAAATGGALIKVGAGNSDANRTQHLQRREPASMVASLP